MDETKGAWLEKPRQLLLNAGAWLRIANVFGKISSFSPDNSQPCLSSRAGGRGDSADGLLRRFAPRWENTTILPHAEGAKDAEVFNDWIRTQRLRSSPNGGPP